MAHRAPKRRGEPITEGRTPRAQAPGNQLDIDEDRGAASKRHHHEVLAEQSPGPGGPAEKAARLARGGVWARPQRGWSQVPGSPGGPGTGRGRPHRSPRRGRSARLQDLGQRVLCPGTRPTGREGGRARRDPGTRRGPDLTMAKAVVGRPRAPAPLALGLGQGKGSAGRSGPAAPLTGAAAASPLAKMAASSHVSNRKWRRSKGEGRSAVGGEIVGTGQRRRPCQGGVGARPPAWGLGLSSLFPFARPSFALRHLLQFIKLS